MNPPIKTDLIRKWFPDLFHLICLFIVSAFFFRDSVPFVYFDLHDESIYLHAYGSLNDGPDAAWGPLYSLFYLVQGLWQEDAFRLYYQNAVLISLMLPFSFYWFLRKYEFSPYLAGVFSYLFLISDYNLFLFPKAAHFQLVLIFLFLGSVRKIKDIQQYLISVFLFSLFLAYIRPKMIVMPVIFLLFLLYLTLRKRSGRMDQLRWNGKKYAICVFFFICMMALWGNPVGNKVKRAAVFDQNYALNRMQRQELAGKPLDPVVESVAGYLTEFLNHVSFNILNFFDLIGSHRFHFPSPGDFNGNPWSSRIQMAFLFCGILLAALLSRRNPKSEESQRMYLIFPFLHSALCVAASSIVYSWARFFFPVFLYGVLLIPRRWRNEMPIRVSLWFCLLFFLQTVIPFSFFPPDPEVKDKYSRTWGFDKSIALLRNMGVLPPGSCLSAPRNAVMYLNGQCLTVNELRRNGGNEVDRFREQIKTEMPDYVFIGRGYFSAGPMDKDSLFSQVTDLGYRVVVLSLEQKEFFLVKYPLAGGVR